MTVADRYAGLAPVPDAMPQALDTVVSVLSRHPVRLAYLFGSAARAGARPQDIDLAVLPAPGFSWRDLYADLSIHFGTDRVDLADLGVAPPEFQFEVIRSGHCLFSRDAEQKEEYERRVRMMFRDELPRLRRRRQALRARLGT